MLRELQNAYYTDGLTTDRIIHCLPLHTPWQIKIFDVLSSTNDYLREQLSSNPGIEEFTAVIANQQTDGHGRLGRVWYSPPQGGLWLSVLLRPVLPPERAQLITLTTAVAIAQTLRDLNFPVNIKWPNDILTAEGKKLCGIKCEMQIGHQQTEWLIVGIGLNINNNNFPPMLGGIAASLRDLQEGRQLCRAYITAAILERLQKDYQTLTNNGFEHIRCRWHHLAQGLGEIVTINTGSEQQSGVMLGLDDNGYLLLKGKGVIKRILAGDMVLRY